MRNNLTVGIVTNNRLKSLSRLFSSLANQSVKPDNVIIVDTSFNRSAVGLCKRFSLRLQIILLTKPGMNVPRSRNLILKRCDTFLLGFVDDDCILHRNWIQVGKTYSGKKQVPFIIGRSLLLNGGSYLALAQYLRHDYWFRNKLRGVIPSPFNFDTKNLVLNVVMIKKAGVVFSESMSIKCYDSADTDFGFQLESKGLIGRYDEKLIVSHQEADSLAGFIKKAYYRGRLAAKLMQKWRISGEFVFKTDKTIGDWLYLIMVLPKEFENYISGVEKGWIAGLGILGLIKLYDGVFFRGFVSQKKLQNRR